MSTLVDTLQPPPTEDQTIAQLQQRVSASKLTLFQACRLRFWFRYVLGLRKPKTAALHVGAAVHAVLSGWNRARWRHQTLGLADLYTTYQAVWKSEQTAEPVAWESVGVEAEQQQTGWRLLETFFRESPIREAGKPDAVEVTVEADLTSHGLPVLVGVIDLVQNQTIIDFKTSSTTPNPQRAALVNATQATAYALLYRENTGGKETGIELHHLVKLKQPKLSVISLPPISQREQHRLFRVIDAYVEGLARHDFIPSPGLQCASCEFFRECAAWSARAHEPSRQRSIRWRRVSLVLFFEQTFNSLRSSRLFCGGEEFPYLQAVSTRQTFQRGKPQLAFSARFDGLVIFVRNSRAFAELLLRLARIAAEFAQPSQQTKERLVTSLRLRKLSVCSRCH